MIPGRVLLADVGGTNIRFALADASSGTPLLPASVAEFKVADFPTLVDAAHHYLQLRDRSKMRVDSGVFAIAGRIEGDNARITNHPWLISRRAASAALGLSHLQLVNDFAAQAMAVTLLGPGDVVAIGDAAWPGMAASAAQTYAVIGPGTGLGVSALIVRDGRVTALETEGGHVGFAPGTAKESAVLECLSRRFSRVSGERLVSGGGLVNIHSALAEIAGETPSLSQPSEITAGARVGDARCQEAIELLCASFGSIAGDLVLTLGAWDGVFLTGGMVKRLLPDLKQSAFRARFDAKGRFAGAMSRVPALAVVHPHAGLLGAAAFAMTGRDRLADGVQP